VRASVRDVLEGDGGVQPEPLGDGLELGRAEAPLRVEVDRLPLGPALRDGHLARDAQRVAQLRLARPELPVHLGDGACLDPALEELVELGRPCRERHERLAILEGVGRRLEVHGDHRLDDLLELEDLGLGDPLDLAQLSRRGVGELVRGRRKRTKGSARKQQAAAVGSSQQAVIIMMMMMMAHGDGSYRLDRVEPGRLELLQVGGVDPMLLQDVDGLVRDGNLAEEGERRELTVREGEGERSGTIMVTAGARLERRSGGPVVHGMDRHHHALTHLHDLFRGLPVLQVSLHGRVLLLNLRRHDADG
jgi:hypothetical protein